MTAKMKLLLRRDAMNVCLAISSDLLRQLRPDGAELASRKKSPNKLRSKERSGLGYGEMQKHFQV